MYIYLSCISSSVNYLTISRSASLKSQSRSTITLCIYIYIYITKILIQLFHNKLSWYENSKKKKKTNKYIPFKFTQNYERIIESKRQFLHNIKGKRGKNH